MLNEEDVDIQEAWIDSQKAPLEQSYLTYISGGWLDNCQEKAGKPKWEIANTNTNMQFQQSWEAVSWVRDEYERLDDLVFCINSI